MNAPPRHVENLEGLSWMQPPEASLDDPAAALSRAHTFNFIHLVTLGGWCGPLPDRPDILDWSHQGRPPLIYQAKEFLGFANAEPRRERLRQHLEPSKVLP